METDEDGIKGGSKFAVRVCSGDGSDPPMPGQSRTAVRTGVKAKQTKRRDQWHYNVVYGQDVVWRAACVRDPVHAALGSAAHTAAHSGSSGTTFGSGLEGETGRTTDRCALFGDKLFRPQRHAFRGTTQISPVGWWAHTVWAPWLARRTACGWYHRAWRLCWTLCFRIEILQVREKRNARKP